MSLLKCKTPKGYPVTFEEIVEKVLDHEGREKYTCDPLDPGGETKFGISKRSNRHVDIKNLTEEQAVKIYKEKYWDRFKIEQLPPRLRYIFFDMTVNPGRSRAIRILQRAANSKNKERDQIRVDGGLGPVTLKALKKVELERVRAFRVLYYAGVVHRRPDQIKWFYGWFKRSMEV